MRKLNIQINEDFLQTGVPNFFIDNYMAAADPVYSLIYIYLLRNGMSGAGGIDDIAQIAAFFDVTETKCLKALKHLEDSGLISLDGKTAPLKRGKVTPVNFPAANDNTPEDDYSKDEPDNVSCPQDKPVYSAEELEAYAQQDIIRDLFSFAQEKLSRMLRYNDLNTLFSLYDWLRLDVAVIKRLLEYCAENSHTNIKYIEAVAVDWAARGIKTTQDADGYIHAFTKTYHEILKAFGITGQTPVPAQVKYMEKWLGDFNMPLEIILEACEKTIMSIGKPNFKYANAVIESWHKAGVTTIDDIINFETVFSKEVPAAENTAPKRRKRNKFANFEGRMIDYNEIEKLEQEYIDSIVKGK